MTGKPHKYDEMNLTISRRDFLKYSGMTIIGSSLLGFSLDAAGQETASRTVLTQVSSLSSTGSGSGTLTLTAPSTVRRGLTADVSLGYRDITGTGAIELALPPDTMTLDEMLATMPRHDVGRRVGGLH